MKEKELVLEFYSKVSIIVSQIKTDGENVSNETTISKVLGCLTKKFDYVVAITEESKDLSKYSFDEVMSSLQVHEVIVSMSYKN